MSSKKIKKENERHNDLNQNSSIKKFDENAELMENFEMISRPFDLTEYSIKKSKKKMRAWCGECYQSFEFGPFAKVCQQHVLKGKCNIYECKKKYINPTISKNCIRKFPNINSENRHMYCVNEEEVKEWDPKLKIQYCNIGIKGLLSELKNSSFFNNSSIEKNRNSSFDSIKFSDLNLELQEHSDDKRTNTDNTINITKDLVIAITQNESLENPEFESKLNNSKILNCLHVNENKQHFKRILKKRKVLRMSTNNISLQILNKNLIKESEEKIIKNTKISDSKNLSSSQKTKLKGKIKQIKSNNSGTTVRDNSNIKNISFHSPYRQLNQCFCFLPKKNPISEIIAIESKPISSEANNNISDSSLEKSKKKNSIHIENERVNKTLIKSLNKSSNKDIIVNNVNGLIDQIGNLKFENSKNDSILEDEILIKQFDNIYFNYKKTIKDCEFPNFENESGLDFLNSNPELNSVEDNMNSNEFDMLENSHGKINLNFHENPEKNSEQGLDYFSNNYDNISINKPNNHSNSIKHCFSTTTKNNNILYNSNNNFNYNNVSLMNSANNNDFQKYFVINNDNNNNNNIFGSQNCSYNYNKKENKDTNIICCNLKYDNDNKKIFGNNFENPKLTYSSPNNSQLPDFFNHHKTNSKKLNNIKSSNLSFSNFHPFTEIFENGPLTNSESKKINQRKKTIDSKDQSCYLLCKELLEEMIGNSINNFKENQIKIFKEIPFAQPNENNNKNFSLHKISNFSLNLHINNRKNIDDSKLKQENILSFNYSNNNHENFNKDSKQNNRFNSNNCKLQVSEGFTIENCFQKKKVYKIPDEFHIDEIFKLINKNTGIPSKYLTKLKDSMKKKGIFNARVLRLFKKKKLGWNFLKKEFVRNCSQIEAISIYIEEILEE